jgi:hypothetical protein
MAWIVGTAVSALLLGVAGCGSSTGSSARTDDAAGDETTLSATTPPTVSDPPKTSKGPSDQIKPRTVRGTVVTGAERGCLELVSPPSRWVLVGPAVVDLQPGDEVEVVGRPAPQVNTSCDGVPLQVRTVRHL